MTFLLFLIFAIVIFGVMFLLSVVRGVASFIFGRPGSSQSRYTSNNTSSTDNAAYNDTRSNKKVFSRDEGEYVKYEEIKD